MTAEERRQLIEIAEGNVSSRQRLVEIAEDNLETKATLVQIAENNVNSNPEMANEVEWKKRDFRLEINGAITVGGNSYKPIDFGQYFLDKNGIQHSNACFYLACTGNKLKARDLKEQLAPLGTKLAREWRTSEGKRNVDFTRKNVMADTEVFMAYAMKKGPICVVNIKANSTIEYYCQRNRDQRTIYLYLQNSHFQRLARRY